MYKTNKATKTTIELNESVEGERIETKIERFIYNNEPIEDAAPLIYTEKAAGVQAGYNIRTDRWEVAAEAMDVVHRSKTAKAAEKPMEAENREKKGGKESPEASQS